MADGYAEAAENYPVLVKNGGCDTGDPGRDVAHGAIPTTMPDLAEDETGGVNVFAQARRFQIVSARLQRRLDDGAGQVR